MSVQPHPRAMHRPCKSVRTFPPRRCQERQSLLFESNANAESRRLRQKAMGRPLSSTTQVRRTTTGELAATSAGHNLNHFNHSCAYPSSEVEFLNSRDSNFTMQHEALVICQPSCRGRWRTKQWHDCAVHQTSEQVALSAWQTSHKS